MAAAARRSQYAPTGHSIGAVVRAGQNEPAGHSTCASGVEQKAPAWHGMQSGSVRPVALLHVPGAQAPLHAAVASPVTFPNLPTGQAFAAGNVAPARQKNPASHGPEHADVVAPARPHRPASQSPVHEARPVALLNWPAGHASGATERSGQ
jgi:hypothetical protein